MFLQKKAQSTAEYAIALGLVVAVAAGVMQVALKGAMKDKHKQAVSYLMDAGNVTGGLPTTDLTDAPLYNQDYRKTTVDDAGFVDKSVMKKGGLEERKQVQTTATSAVSIETLDSN